MIDSKHWLICVDLTNMDDILIGYASFLASVHKPETITFLHIIDSGPTAMDIVRQFPEISSGDEFRELLRGEIQEKIDTRFETPGVDVRLSLKEGRPTNKIIEVVNNVQPDLLLMGKKVGYVGEGVIPRQILKYVATSILFVPENSRFSLQSALVPVDFSEQSAKGLRAAVELMNKTGGQITAQHIYEYRAQYFPYMLSEEEKRKVDAEVRKKKEDFVQKYNFDDNIDFVLSRHNKGKLAQTVYDVSIRNQADILIVGSKTKKLPSLIRHDFTDKMVNYAFGIPLLILKNKEKYQLFLKSLFKE